ncbi:MAG: TRAP transporter small permease [Casimicrobiaceae bacterium]
MLGKTAERIVDALAIALFAAMFGIVILQIALRYVFNHPLVFSDEVASYLFVWISFLGWTMASRRRIHIGIGVVLDRLPPAARRGLHAFWSLATAAFAVVLLVVGVAITRRNGDVQMVSLDFAMWPVYAVVPLTAILLIAYSVRDVRTIFRDGDVRATETQL